jgi:putative ABC transport system ATP-binding protein
MSELTASLKNISKIYPSIPPIYALDDISLDIFAGDYLSIVGPSGSGKSTLLNILGMLDQASSGDYEFEGVNVNALKETELAEYRGQKIGFVFQKFHLLKYRTLLDNVSMAGMYDGILYQTRLENASRALELVGLGHRQNAYPTELSGGQCQRVAIARAIAGSPKLLICDEPTGNLDSVMSEQIMEIFEKLNALGTTLVIVTHSNELAKRAKRVVQVKDGKIVEKVL